LQLEFFMISLVLDAPHSRFGPPTSPFVNSNYKVVFITVLKEKKILSNFFKTYLHYTNDTQIFSIVI